MAVELLISAVEVKSFNSFRIFFLIYDGDCFKQGLKEVQDDLKACSEDTYNSAWEMKCIAAKNILFFKKKQIQNRLLSRMLSTVLVLAAFGSRANIT